MIFFYADTLKQEAVVSGGSAAGGYNSWRPSKLMILNAVKYKHMQLKALEAAERSPGFRPNMMRRCR